MTLLLKLRSKASVLPELSIECCGEAKISPEAVTPKPLGS